MLTRMNSAATVREIETDCGMQLAVTKSTMTKLTASRPASSSGVLDPAENLTDDIVEPDQVDFPDLGDRSLAELSLEQLGRLASRWADELIPRSSASPQLVVNATSLEHINPILAELWSRGQIRDDYIDRWRLHASTCDVCSRVIEATQARR